VIDYAGVGLAVPTPDLQDFLDRWWDSTRPGDANASPKWDIEGIGHLPTPNPPPVKSDRPVLGRLTWPVGASRWATFHHLVTQAQLAAIRTAIGSTAAAKPLTISDGTNLIAPDLWMLPARPVCRRGSDELFLLALVDERYFWWQEGDQSPNTTTYASWSALYSDLFAKVGVGSPTLETVASAYSTPTDRWAVGPKPIPLLLDAAAELIGQRVVRRLDGTVATVGATAGLSALDSQYTLRDKDRVSGGKLDAVDIGKAVPASVAVLFYGSPPVISTVTLGSLSLSGYAGGTGVSGRTGQFWADMAGTASSGLRSALATQAATDLYTWGLCSVEATYRGVVPWVLSGGEDAVEIECIYDGAEPRILTRVHRPPLVELGAVGANGVPGSGSTIYVPRLARITGSNGGTPPAYSWTALDVSAGTWPDSALTGTNNAYQTPTAGGGTPTAAPIGSRVWIWPDGSAFGFYPAEEASLTGPGHVSTGLQSFAGHKLFVAENHAVVLDTGALTPDLTYSYQVSRAYNQPLFAVEKISAGVYWASIGGKGSLGSTSPIYSSQTTLYGNNIHSWAGSQFYVGITGTPFTSLGLTGSGFSAGTSGSHGVSCGTGGFSIFGGGASISSTGGTITSLVGTGDQFQIIIPNTNSGMNLYAGAYFPNTSYNAFISEICPGAGSTESYKDFYSMGLRERTLFGNLILYKEAAMGQAAFGIHSSGSSHTPGTVYMGGTQNAGGLQFVGGLYISGSPTGTPIGSGGSSPGTTITGIFSGDGTAINGRTLAAPAAGFTISNANGAAGNPTFALADDLAALEGMVGTGLVARTAANTYAQRTLVAPAAGITIADAGGVAGNPTLALANDLAALEGLGSTGIAVRTAADTWVQRQITSTGSTLTITNPAGVAGDINIDAAFLQALTPGGRITYSSSDPLAYGSSNTSIYYLPYTSNAVAVYNGSKWVLRTFSSINISSYIINTVYDIFLYDNAGTLAGEQLAWTNTTTRATALAYQDGVLVKSGDATRRYVGTVYSNYLGVGPSSSGIWNLYNQVDITLEKNNTNSHTYNTSTVREWNNNAGSRIEIIIGLSNQGIIGLAASSITNSANSVGACGCGINTSTSFGNLNHSFAGVLSNNFIQHVHAAAMSVAGLNYVTVTEWGNAGGANAPTFVQATTRAKIRG
jgi:hypothetical protein